jgi:L-lactate dehydrogenase complex protein LldF
LARKKIHYSKYKALENLEKNIGDFETKFTSRGGKVLYALNTKDAQNYVEEILEKHHIQKVVKSKSMMCEEIDLERFLEEKNVKVLETDLGEFIVQLAKEKPSHITAPALHKSKKEIYDLLNEKYNENFDENTDVSHVVQFVRNLLREEFSIADAGITGGNFLIADQGIVAICENEANASLTFNYPRIQIIITSIDKVLPSFDNLELFQSMLATFGTGQKLTVYNHLIYGPSKKEEKFGSEQIYVILLDNNRTKIMQNVFMRQAIYCIKCGACHNHCPVFKQIGGHAYQSVHSGPIGSIVSSYIFDEKDFSHLIYATTLCGKCNTICPSYINLTDLFIERRRMMNSSKINTSSERLVFKTLQRVLKKRKRMDRYSSFLKNLALKIVLRKNWGQYKSIPIFAVKSYNKIKKTEKRKH